MHSLYQGGASVASAQTDAHTTSLQQKKNENTSAVSLEAVTYADDNLGKTRHKCV